jgi:hypothetical protein
VGRTAARPTGDPELEWAVVADPFGNEFCVIRDTAG